MNRLIASRLLSFFVRACPWCFGLGLLVFLSSLSGCLLLNWSSAWWAEDTTTSTSNLGNVLGKIPTSKTSVVLEIVFVERPADDPLLGPQLWDEVDQIGSLPASKRAELAKLGFRIGRVGAQPPRALQTLMGLSLEVANDEENRLVGRRVVLPSGAETEINTGMPQPQATLQLPTGEQLAARSFENVRGVFRLTAKQLQDGWARVDFLPEIHHGRVANRAVPVRGDWQLQTTQAIERLYKQHFSLDLNLGEMVIITSQVEPAQSVGQMFFQAAEFSPLTPPSEEHAAPAGSAFPSSPGIQRLLVVRLADLNVVESVYSK